MISEFYEKLDHSIIKFQFSAKSRIIFYSALALLLKNGVLIDAALKQMYEIFSEKGKKTKSARAVVIYDCWLAVREGKSLSRSLDGWVDSQEVSLIAAGERSGELKKALDDVIKVIKAKQQIFGAVLMATAYPSVLMVMICILLNMVATVLIPKFERSSHPESWQGPAAWLYQISEFINHYGKLSIALIVILLILIFSTFSVFRGPIRVYLDKIPPWSVYRMLHGATFLLNVSVMLEAGIKLRDSLRMLADKANPWLAERIEAAYYGTGIGGNLGIALDRAGYNFPDRLAIQYLMILATLDGFEAAITDYGMEWLNESIKKIQAFAKVFLGLGIVIIICIIIFIIAGVNGIQEAIQAGYH